MRGVLPLFRSLIFAAVCAGVVAGTGLTLLHFFITSPLIAQAETFEDSGAGNTRAADHHNLASFFASQRITAEQAQQAREESAKLQKYAPDSRKGAAHLPGLSRSIEDSRAEFEDASNRLRAGLAHAQDPAPGVDFWRRAALTWVTDLSAGIGFALLLCAGLVLRGGQASLWNGLLWGLAGFASLSLAPALGLPPELPGTEVPPILTRQIWWLATAWATAGGFALLAFSRQIGWMACGVALVVAPHLVGAPRLARHASLVPEELTRLFVTGAITSNLVFWALLGLTCVMALRLFEPMPAPSERGPEMPRDISAGKR